MRQFAAAVLLVVCAATPSNAQTPADSSPKLVDISRLIPQNDDTYVRVPDSPAWETSYRGKNIPSIKVRIVGAEKGVFFFVHLFEREKLVLSRNLLLKLLELNDDMDYVKLVLDEDSLTLRVDALMDAIGSKELDSLAEQAALAADQAYGTIKDFLP